MARVGGPERSLLSARVRLGLPGPWGGGRFPFSDIAVSVSLSLTFCSTSRAEPSVAHEFTICVIVRKTLISQMNLAVLA